MGPKNIDLVFWLHSLQVESGYCRGSSAYILKNSTLCDIK